MWFIGLDWADEHHDICVITDCDFTDKMATFAKHILAASLGQYWTQSKQAV